MRDKVVCPECYSPYLSTEVMATAKVNRDFDWELEFIPANDLFEAISNPNTAIECEHCGWSGGYGDLLSLKESGLDGIQHDTGASYNTAAFSDVVEIPNTFGKPEPKIDLGTILFFDKEEYTIISKTNINVMRTLFYDGKVHRSQHPSVLYTVTPVDQNLYPEGKFISLTETFIRNGYLRGKIDIIN